MRSRLVSNWIAQSDWALWQRTPMTGDASARRYERLESPNGQSVILMDAPVETCGSQSRFVEIADHLRDLGLAAPRVFEWSETLGLMILEDLGQNDFSSHLKSKPDDDRHLYEKAVDTLLVLQSAPPPPHLSKMTPDVGCQMIDLAFEWAATDQSSDLHNQIKAELHDLLVQVDPLPSVLSLRDFHAENLIWRPEQPTGSQVGLLDFQDAFVTHPTYDLASLLRDARRDVDPSLIEPMLTRLSSNATDVDEFRTAFHVMALQRNLRILGIFQRLAAKDGKAGYLSLLPRVWSHIQSDLAAPVLSDLAPLVRRAFQENGKTA